MIDLVDLKGGLVLPAEALRLAMDLESRGITMRDAGDQQLSIGKGLTPADRVAIKRWKLHLLAILAYRVPPDLEPVILGDSDSWIG